MKQLDYKMSLMFTNKIFFIFLLFSTSLLIVSCTKDQVQAENSLVGLWDVTFIRSHYGKFSETTFNTVEPVEDMGELGTFNFMEESVHFDFMRNDSLFSTTTNWVIEVDKVNAGFTRTLQFTLDIENHFLFDVRFEDATSNSEKDANSVFFTTIPMDNSGIFLEISLEKR